MGEEYKTFKVKACEVFKIRKWMKRIGNMQIKIWNIYYFKLIDIII